MKTFNSVEKSKVSKAIETIERHLTPTSTSSRVRLDRRASKFVAEWQENGPETLPGLAIRKLRLSFAPSQLVLAASTAV